MIISLACSLPFIVLTLYFLEQRIHDDDDDAAVLLLTAEFANCLSRNMCHAEGRLTVPSSGVVHGVRGHTSAGRSGLHAVHVLCVY